MHPFLLIVMLFTWLQSPSPTPGEIGHPQQHQSESGQKQSATDHHGTEQSPLVVKVLPPDKAQDESSQAIETRKQETANNRSAIPTAILALIAFLQLVVYTYQAIKLRETVDSARQQSAAMERHIGEAARSATAMEAVATTMQVNAARQLRAYLTVVVGAAIYQDREDGKVFEGKPLLVNNGFTTARNIRHWTKAAILPFTLPDDFVLPAVEEVFVGQGIIGAHQNASMSIRLDEQVPDGEVADIKFGKGKALYVWGIVRYEDVFDKTHTTKFCQAITWLVDGRVFGFYTPGHNDAD
jgi:hypothetical protein